MVFFVLHQVLCEIDLPDWSNHVYSSVNNFFYSISVWNSPCRGIRPLSPYPFVLCLEKFSHADECWGSERKESKDRPWAQSNKERSEREGWKERPSGIYNSTDLIHWSTPSYKLKLLQIPIAMGLWLARELLHNMWPRTVLQKPSFYGQTERIGFFRVQPNSLWVSLFSLAHPVMEVEWKENDRWKWHAHILMSCPRIRAERKRKNLKSTLQ